MPNLSLSAPLQTTCTECQSVFSLNCAQLLAADGRVRCSQCHEVFDANIYLENIPQETSQNENSSATEKEPLVIETPPFDAENTQATDANSVSLTEAMYEGTQDAPKRNLSNLYWFLGIIGLVFLAITQWVYYERYQLIQDETKQHFVLSLCDLLNCDRSLFKNSNQFSLLERNIFTHPNTPNALLITGSFVNEAPFEQKAPQLKISLFNIQGEVIAQRIFEATEYRQDAGNNTIVQGETIHFKLEIEDPNTVTITYEFEFL